MMKEVIVLSRPKAEQFNPAVPYAVVSIRCPFDEPVKFPDIIKPIHLAFSDISRDQFERFGKNTPLNEKPLVLFSKDQARAIFDFVDEQLAAGVERFMVHCHAGISRSPGVALALKQIYMGDPVIPPAWRLYNSTVYQIMIRENFYRGRDACNQGEKGTSIS